jgi:mono/diheme cytochrome c family protein
MPLRKRARLAMLLPLALGACDFWYDKVPSPDQLWYRIAWFDHMIHTQQVSPYQRADVPRYVVKGTVPVGGGEADWDIGDAANLAYAFDAPTADRLVNPTKADGSTQPRPGPEMPRIPGTLTARGDTLYNTYCATCHGVGGAGNGPVSTRLVGVPSLLTDRARGYTDGYLYSIIRYGRGLMPKYGDKLPDQLDRWAIVNHVRALQEGAPAPAPATSGGQN